MRRLSQWCDFISEELNIDLNVLLHNLGQPLKIPALWSGIRTNYYLNLGNLSLHADFDLKNILKIYFKPEIITEHKEKFRWLS